ncbi:hypothetical protein [Streptomyces sp. NPDC086023]
MPGHTLPPPPEQPSRSLLARAESGWKRFLGGEDEAERPAEDEEGGS